MYNRPLHNFNYAYNTAKLLLKTNNIPLALYYIGQAQAYAYENPNADIMERCYNLNDGLYRKAIHAYYNR